MSLAILPMTAADRLEFLRQIGAPPLCTSIQINLPADAPIEIIFACHMQREQFDALQQHMGTREEVA